MESTAKHPFRRRLPLKVVQWLRWEQGSSRRTGRASAGQVCWCPFPALCPLTPASEAWRVEGAWAEAAQSAASALEGAEDLLLLTSLIS